MEYYHGFHRNRGVPPGRYVIEASRAGYGPKWRWSEDTIQNGGPWLDPEYLRKYEDRAIPVRIQSEMKTIVDRPIAVF